MGHVRVDGILGGFADFLLEVTAETSFHGAHEEIIQPACTAVESDLQPVDVARAARGSDGWLTRRGRAQGHRHRYGSAGSAGVEAAVVADWENDVIFNVPVTVKGNSRSRETPCQSSAGVDGEC